MASQLVFLAIHGIGDETANMADDLKAGLKTELQKRGMRRFGFHFASYHDLLPDQPETVWEQTAGSEIGIKGSRALALRQLGHAVPYQYRSEGRGSLYRQIHDRIRLAIAEANEDLNEGGSLVILAQSFGCQLLSNYIWDLQKGIGLWERGRPRPQDRLGSLKLLMTTGCSIPLFVAGLDKIEAFEKPNEEFNWLNFYDRRDPFGWPLKPLSSDFENSFDNLVTGDVAVRTGAGVQGHINYWKKRHMLWKLAHAALTYTGLEEQLRSRRRRRR